MMRKPLSVVLALCLTVTPTQAHEGHDEAPAPVSSNAPTRLPDGSVFVPKAAQRQLTVRTTTAQPGNLPRSVVLSAQVVLDPHTGGQVQPTVAGRLQAGPNGLPTVGQHVRKGQILAYVTATIAPTEQAAQTAQLAEWQAALALADKRLARLLTLEDTVPRKDIETLQSERASLAARAAAVSKGLATREALTAPVSGVIASAYAVAGQVVDAGALLYEVVDPQRLHIEALTFEPQLAANVAAASTVVHGKPLPLRLIGSAHALREQALPLRFAPQHHQEHPTLVLGQRLDVTVQTQNTVPGLAMPQSALVKNPSNQTIVWVKTAPEHFSPRVVTTAPLDGTYIAVTSGLTAGERVVVQAASLINQIR